MVLCTRCDLQATTRPCHPSDFPQTRPKCAQNRPKKWPWSRWFGIAPAQLVSSVPTAAANQTLGDHIWHRARPGLATWGAWAKRPGAWQQEVGVRGSCVAGPPQRPSPPLPSAKNGCIRANSEPALWCNGIADGLQAWRWQLAAVRFPPAPGRESWRGAQTKARYNAATRGHAPNGARTKKKHPSELWSFLVVYDLKPLFCIVVLHSFKL